MTAFEKCNGCGREIKKPNDAVMVDKEIYHQSCTSKQGIPLNRFYNWFDKEVK